MGDLTISVMLHARKSGARFTTSPFDLIIGSISLRLKMDLFLFILFSFSSNMQRILGNMPGLFDLLTFCLYLAGLSML